MTPHNVIAMFEKLNREGQEISFDEVCVDFTDWLAAHWKKLTPEDIVCCRMWERCSGGRDMRGGTDRK